MKAAFSFFLRLFVCFVAAKLVVQAVDLNSRGYLLALTAVLLVNVYLLDYLVFRDRRAARENSPAAPPVQHQGEPPAPNDS